MSLFKAFVTILFLTSSCLSAALPAQKRDSTADINAVSSVVNKITHTATSIINDLSNTTVTPHSRNAVNPAFSADVKILAQAFDDTAHLFEHANTIPVDFVNDTRIINLKNGFASFFVDAITNLSTIALSPNTTNEEADLLLKETIPPITHTLDEFTDAVVDTDTEGYLDSISAALAPAESAQIPGPGTISDILAGLYARL